MIINRRIREFRRQKKMSKMKKIALKLIPLLLVSALVVFVSSCSKDDDDDVQQSLVGTWDMSFELTDDGMPLGPFGYIVFKSDGTFEQNDGSIITGNYSYSNKKLRFSNVSDSDHFDILTWNVLSISDDRIKVNTPGDDDVFWLIKRNDNKVQK